ncbi:unnamed protein product [Dicrocoelium dendriticum]|nr:unnamed protein product [Dicrocoelium dendriticum]
MPDLSVGSKPSSRTSASRKRSVSKLSPSLKGRDAKQFKGKTSSTASKPMRRRRSHSSSASQSSDSSSSDSGSDSTASNTTQSSLESPKQSSKLKDSKSSSRHRPSKSNKLDPTTLPSNKSTDVRRPQEDSKKLAVKPSESSESKEVLHGEAAPKQKNTSSLAIVSESLASSTAAPPLDVANSVDDKNAPSQKSQPSVKTTTKPAKSMDIEVAKDKKEKGKQSAEIPAFTRVLVEKLTRNVTKAHVAEIFSVWGVVQSVDMPPDRLHPEFSRSYAYVTYDDPKSAADAVNFMNGGQVDGEVIRVTEVFSRSTALGRTELRAGSIDRTQHNDREKDESKRAPESISAPTQSNKEERRLDESTERRHERTRPNEELDRRRDARERDRERDRQRERERERQRGRDRPRERDRSRGSRPRRARRGSSGSPFASRSNLHQERQRSPMVGSRYRRPSPPASRTEPSGGRRARSRSPMNKPQAAARAAVDSKTAAARRGRGVTSRSSSSSSSDSDSSNSSTSSSRSGSSSSSSSSSSRSRT